MSYDILKELPIYLQADILREVKRTRWKSPELRIFKNPCKCRFEITIYNKRINKYKLLVVYYSDIVKYRKLEKPYYATQTNQR